MDLSSTPARRQPRPASGLQSNQPPSSKNVETEMHRKSGQNATPKQNGALNVSNNNLVQIVAALNVSNHNLGQIVADIGQLSIDPPKSQHVDNGKSGESDVLGHAMLSSVAELTSKATRSKDPINSSLRHVELDTTCSPAVLRE